MTGCRHNAKNTLVKNYLYLAERAGATVFPETTAARVRPLDGGGGYAVDTVRTGAWRARRTTRRFTARQVVFAAGTWGTQQLLHAMRTEGSLPAISAMLGVLTRTNSESLGGALTTVRNRKKHDFTRGVAITSSIHMALWPNNGDRDPRPALGLAYQRIVPVAPRNPAVPSSAPAALRLPSSAVHRAES